MSEIHENKQELKTWVQKLGNAAAGSLPEDWEHIVIGYFISGDTTHMQFHASTVSLGDYMDLQEEAWDSDEYDHAIIEVQRCCKKIRSICAGVKDCWSSMTFSMMADGTFNIDYDYERIEDYNSAFVLNWQSRYLL